MRHTATFNDKVFVRCSENTYVACVIVVRTQVAFDAILKDRQQRLARIEQGQLDLGASEKSEAEWVALANAQEKAYFDSKHVFYDAERDRREAALPRHDVLDVDIAARRAEQALDDAYYADSRARKIVSGFMMLRNARKWLIDIDPVGYTWCKSWHQTREAAQKVARSTLYRHPLDEVHVVTSIVRG